MSEATPGGGPTFESGAALRRQTQSGTAPGPTTAARQIRRSRWTLAHGCLALLLFSLGAFWAHHTVDRILRDQVRSQLDARMQSCVGAFSYVAGQLIRSAEALGKDDRLIAAMTTLGTVDT
ncbi:MAG TPA: hypothetical protein VLC09_13535, partial [Polyangiaceae bacterium]|nr:hypothetical protein [Polyangiaceae bacterium]